MLRRAENVVLASALTLMALLPLAEILLRATFQVGISGAASFTQHCALIAGMLGAAVAAREGRLLSLSMLDTLLEGRCALLARLFTRTVAVIVGALLCLASVEFVLAERAGGNVIAYGIPVWLGQAVLPLGFALITLRLAWAAADSWPARLATLALAAAVAAAALNRLPLNNAMAIAAISVVLVAALLGSPVFTTLGGAALFLFWNEGLPMASIPLDHYRLVVNPSLPMIPLFTLAGYFLAEGGAPGRLIRVFDALFGGLRGGAAIVTVVACAFFTSFSGASGVTIIALGGMLMPLLLSAGYSQKSALGLLAGAGSLGGLLPPGLPLVLYAIVAKISIEEMFLAGIVPGLLMVTLIALWGFSRAPRVVHAARKLDWREARAALLAAKWELLLPPVAFLGLFGGFATPVEAAALTAVYAFIVEVLVYRDLGLRSDVPRVMAECGLLVGGVLLILGVALGFTNYLVDARIPERAVDWVTGAIHSRWMFLLALNLFLLVAGCLLDIFSATVVLVPLMVPLGIAFGVDPIHLGIIFLTNMELGYLTPPVGMNLFFTAYRFGKPLPEVFSAALPAVGVLAIGVLLVTFVPWLATGLPQFLR
ncbi:MAG: TRAP transporter large permease subunit [Betaproteobacteria bacterium]|nr:MAG: TRAP transporter large permease subunit [Betaproteobacteria bacterium]